MKNLRSIHDFTNQYQEKCIDIEVHNPINEIYGEGSNLDNKPLSEPDVSDWLWDFDIKLNDFPKGGSNDAFFELLDTDEKLSIFTAQLVNTFVASSWYMVTSKSTINEIFSEEDTNKIRKKLRGHFGIKKRLDRYKIERDEVIKYTKSIMSFIFNGEFGSAIQSDSSNIILRKTGSTESGILKSAWSSLKSFFKKASYRNAIYWLISNLSTNKSYVKWINQLSWPSRTEYISNAFSTGITPEVKSAFESFVVNTKMSADIPNLAAAESALNFAASKAIEWSLEKRKTMETDSSWMGTLLNTDLFGLFQRLLIISTCNWVYGLIGEKDVMSSLKKDVSTTHTFDTAPSAITELDLQIYKGIEVYSIPYLAQEFKELLDVLLSTDEIGKSRYERIVSQINKKEDSRAIVSIVSRDIKNWAQKNIDNIDNFKEMKALGTDYSTRIRIPVKLYDIMMQSK